MLSLFAFSTIQLVAEVQVAPFFTSNAVLQQKAKVPVWGTASPGEKIKLTIGDREVPAVADEKGRWIATLDGLTAGGPFVMTISGKSNTITLQNILVGEVWFCAGQSNMVLPVSAAANREEEIANASHPQIRLFNEMKTGTENLGWPERDGQAQWQVCSPETVGTFSAAAYYFARELQKKLNVPIGLIHASAGGSKIEAWTAIETLRAEPEVKPLLDRWEKDTANYPQLMERYRVAYADWEAKAGAARTQGSPAPAAPRRVYGPGQVYEPGGLYERFVAPLIPYGIRGVIWYQGESNASAAALYHDLFPKMIISWRQAWNRGDFPFLFVQLPRYDSKTPPHPYYDKVTWPEVREAQLMALSLPNTAMAVTIDINSDPAEIHPKQKQEVGTRLALAARGAVYLEPVVYSGPVYGGMSIDKEVVTLTFHHAENGLGTKDNAPIEGFAIAGEDKIFVPAEAVIKDGKVQVHSDKIAVPVAVRYGWDAAPAVNLCNKEGLPASPFRTDNWALSTAGKF